MINAKNISKQISLPQRIALILFGLFLTIIILEIGLRIGGFTIISLQEHKNLQSIKQKGEFRIMCLGESTTQGQYPHCLEEILNQHNIGIKFSVIDKGICGINTSGILGQLESNLDQYCPDIVVAMMGVNDGGRYIPYEAASKSKIILTLRSFKTYKLARLLWLHIVTKFKGKGFYISASNNQIVRELPGYVPGYKSGETRKQQGFFQHEQASKKAIELNPNNDSAYIELGWLCKDQGKLIESEQAFKKAIELNSNNGSAYIELGWLYKNQGKLIEAEQIFKKAIELNPNNERLYGGLAMIYSEIGNNELSKMYAEKINSLRDKYYNSVMVNNYHMLKQILDKRKIRLVCVQYPMCNIESLKKIFRKEVEGSIVFVDNERIFKDAIKNKDCKTYFRDMFGGDFGHCTPKGNRLLAENIANAILKEIFDK